MSTGMCVGCSRAWYERNKEKKAAEYLANKEKNKQRKAKKAKEYYLKNKDRLLAQQREYYNANKGQWLIKSHKRRANGLPTYVKPDDVNTLKRLQQNKCPVCKSELSKFHLDHIVPLSKGGRHEFTNLQLLCPTCNLNKHAKDPVLFMQSKGFLL